MKQLGRNILALFLGLIAGSIVNMLFVMVGHALFPVEEMQDVQDYERLSAIINNLNWGYFLIPFIAHAKGTFVGVYSTYSVAKTYKKTISLCCRSNVFMFCSL